MLISYIKKPKENLWNIFLYTKCLLTSHYYRSQNQFSTQKSQPIRLRNGKIMDKQTYFHCPNLLIFNSSTEEKSQIFRENCQLTSTIINKMNIYPSVLLSGIGRFLDVHTVIGRAIRWTWFYVHFVGSLWLWLTEFWRRGHLAYLIDDDDTKKTKLRLSTFFTLAHTHAHTPELQNN